MSARLRYPPTKTPTSIKIGKMYLYLGQICLASYSNSPTECMLVSLNDPINTWTDPCPDNLQELPKGTEVIVVAE